LNPEEKAKKILTDWTGFFVALLCVLGIANAFLATVLWHGVIAETFTGLGTNSAGERAGIPWRPRPPVSID
jgi:hypothetical protein